MNEQAPKGIKYPNYGQKTHSSPNQCKDPFGIFPVYATLKRTMCYYKFQIKSLSLRVCSISSSEQARWTARPRENRLQREHWHCYLLILPLAGQERVRRRLLTLQRIPVWALGCSRICGRRDMRFVLVVASLERCTEYCTEDRATVRMLVAVVGCMGRAGCILA